MTLLQANVVHDLAIRLASHASLRLPGSLQRPGEEPPGQQKREEYLSCLLQRDAGVFLERHGGLLEPEDLQIFEPLRCNDYEVDFYMRSLQDSKASAQPQLSPKVRNRRLAKLNRLVDEGEHFTDEAMRSRAPLLHHQYVGQYRARAPLEAAPSGAEHPLSARLLTHIDEAAQAALLQHELEADAMVEQESSDEEAYPEDRRAEVPQDDRHPSSDAEQPALPSREPVDASAAAEPSSPHVVKTTAEGTAGKGQLGSPPSKEAAEPVERQQEAGEAHFVHIPEDERRQLGLDFLKLMHQRFLAGEDDAFVSYAGIDADESLDDDWAAVARQDAEDRYFEDVE